MTQGADPVLATPGARALLTDQYELTMLRAYLESGMESSPATFSLFYRSLPRNRNFALACGLDDALRYLEELRFDDEALDYLSRRPEFEDGDFLEYLATLRFTGAVRAMPEGTPVFPDEPLLEVTAPIGEAQLVESFLMNRIHVQTVLASKGVRVALAAGDSTVVDFGLRRMHGADAALGAARAFHIAGVDATSNVLAGKIHGVPVTGTMAHSFIQAHETEEDAFRAFVRTYPETVLLIDTYDTRAGARKVVELARELGDDFAVRGVRLDSGNLGELARDVRAILDDGGLGEVKIFASGGLDEYGIRDLLADGAPIDGFGVGTRMGVSEDAPALDMAYKLIAYEDRGRLKLSTGKRMLPGPKQVFRVEDGGVATRDVLARASEDLPGRPLLQLVMNEGRRLPAGTVATGDARSRAAREVARLPERIRGLDPADPPYPVETSPGLASYQDEVEDRLRHRMGA